MDNSMYISDNITRKVSLVASVVDDFTSKTVTGSGVRVYIEGERPPIKKPDGFFVFVDLRPGKYKITADGGLYNRFDTECEIKSGAEGYVSIKMRLTPNRQYPIPSGTVCVDGTAMPGADVRIFCTDKASAFRLLGDYAAGDRSIGVYHPASADIEGRLLVIEGADGVREYFRAGCVGDGEEMMYKLVSPLKKQYKKIGTTIYPVAETTADALGRFFMPVAGAYKEVNPYFCEATAGAENVSAELEFRSGVCNKVALIKK